MGALSMTFGLGSVARRFPAGLRTRIMVKKALKQLKGESSEARGRASAFPSERGTAKGFFPKGKAVWWEENSPFFPVLV